VIVYRQLGEVEARAFDARELTDLIDRRAAALTLADRDAALEVRQLKRGLAIAAVVRAEERKQGGVLGDAKGGAVGDGPAAGCKIETDGEDLTDEGRRHELM